MFNGYKTIIGAIIAITPAIASLFGYQVAPEFSEQATSTIFDFITIAGGAIAIYGRVTAQSKGWFSK